MSFRIVLMIVLLSICMLGYAVQDNYLLKIDLNEIESMNDLQGLYLPVYHISDDVLICGTDNLKELYRSEIPFEVIDDQAWTEKYYILSDKRGSVPGTDIGLGKELFRNESIVLIKSAPLTTDQIISVPYKITEMFPIPLEYRTDTFHSSRRTEIPVYRSDVDELVSEINPDSLGYFIQSLEDFGTRFCFAPNRDEVASWIENEFLRFGYTDVVIDSFMQQGIWHKNVVATLPGTINPDQVVIIGGHHDSIIFQQYGNPMNIAPGADDNGTGTGAALEIARAMKAIDFQPETTIKFVTFAAEEVGLWGSHHYAQSALQNGMNIKLMINNDMIGYTTQSQDNWSIHLIEYTGHENEANLARQIIDQYTSLTPITETYNAAYSDSYAFWIRGFPSIFFIETFFNPYYHTPNDLFIHLNMDYAVETVKATAAIAASINYLPDVPEDFIVTDAGNGTELIASWSPVTSPGLDYYEIHVGLSSGDYHTVYSTEETTFTVPDLQEGITYYIGVSAVSTSGYSSTIVESTGIPGFVPLTPIGFTDFPQTDSIELTWIHNLEADLAGYNLYRSETEGEPGALLNPHPLEANSYSDTDVEPGVLYYYSLTAIDENSYESEPTEQVWSRLITLDQGILIVAGTADGSGNFQNPTLENVTQFYNEILSDYSPAVYPLWSENRVKLADLGAYSTLIWHRNNASALLYSQETIDAVSQYLDAGGNILFTTYFPGRLLGGTDNYPQSYSEGDFIYDYLKISSVTLGQSSRFVSADPLASAYPFLIIDEEKAPSALNYHIINVESVHSSADGTDIYSYHSDYPPGSNEASMQGLPVGVEYLSDDYKTVLLSFPLYYIDQGDAASLISYIMNEKFNEQTGTEEEDILPVSSAPFRLYANYPNPFNPETSIRFSLEKGSEITLSVYNLKGQRVKVLVSGEKPQGEYTVVWNGKDVYGREAASGIYFYQLKTDHGADIRKMLFLK